MSTPALPFWQTKNALSLRFRQWSNMNCSALLLVFVVVWDMFISHIDFKKYQNGNREGNITKTSFIRVLMANAATMSITVKFILKRNLRQMQDYQEY